jgi:alpha-N-acetylglucosamine transferase
LTEVMFWYTNKVDPCTHIERVIYSNSDIIYTDKIDNQFDIYKMAMTSTAMHGLVHAQYSAMFRRRSGLTDRNRAMSQTVRD